MHKQMIFQKNIITRPINSNIVSIIEAIVIWNFKGNCLSSKNNLIFLFLQ